MAKGIAQGEAWTLAREQREAVKSGAVEAQKFTFEKAVDEYLKDKLNRLLKKSGIGTVFPICRV